MGSNNWPPTVGGLKVCSRFGVVESKNLSVQSWNFKKPENLITCSTIWSFSAFHTFNGPKMKQKSEGAGVRCIIAVRQQCADAP